MRNSRQQEGCKNMHKEKLDACNTKLDDGCLFLLHSLLQQGLLLRNRAQSIALSEEEKMTTT
jgi:hypothetical protein